MIARNAQEKRELAKKLEQHWPEFLELLKVVSAEFGPLALVGVMRVKNHRD